MIYLSTFKINVCFKSYFKQFIHLLDFWQLEIPFEALHLTIGWDLAPSEK